SDVCSSDLEKESQHDSQTQWRCQATHHAVNKGDVGIRQRKDGHDNEVYGLGKRMGKCFQRGMFSFSGLYRDGKGGEYPCNGSMDAGMVYEIPHNQSGNQIKDEVFNAYAVKYQKCSKDQPCIGQVVNM